MPRHKVFADTAKRGKGTMSCFYGLKLHLLVNHMGEIISFVLQTRVIQMIERQSPIDVRI